MSASARVIPIRTGQIPAAMAREQFGVRFRASYADPAFRSEYAAIAKLEEIAWDGYTNNRKALATQPAGASYADPTYELSTEWLATKKKIAAAEQQQKDSASPSRVLLICGSARNDGSCAGETSKSFRLTGMAQEIIEQADMHADVIDLSLLTSEYGKYIHPCKGCVSTAMPLCHWPCSCYPNHAMNQTNDWMAEIYERWAAAHAVIIITPVYWYQSPSPLKLMIDRLVCADGGNPDPTATHGKSAAEAKVLEEKGWSYPKHLAGRAYGVVVHGDVAGTEVHRRNLTDWLDWIGLIDAGASAKLDRYIGYYENYSSSHDALDLDLAVQEEVRNVARSVAQAVRLLRAGQLLQPDQETSRVRPK
jgi:multimeric flavodoxin WrbA